MRLRPSPDIPPEVIEEAGLVETAEKSRRHCLMMENCCYDRPEMLCLNLVKKGLLGEIFHAEAGYLHDLRGVKFSGTGESLWRPQHSIKRNGNLNPTHGLGPVSQCLDINRGDRFDYLVSMSSKSIGLNFYCAKKFGPDSQQARQKYALGDVNVSLIHTVNGKIITLYHDTSSPRPYSRIHIVQGTQGIFEKNPDRVYIEGRSPADEWELLENYYIEHDHPVWKSRHDTAMWLFDDTPQVVSARSGKIRHDHEDFATIMLGFKDNKVAVISSNWITPPRVRHFNAVSTDGIISGDFVTQEVKIEKDQGSEIPRKEKQEPLTVEIKAFLDAVKSKTTPRVQAEEAVNVTKIAEAALLSSQKGVPIYLDLK